jgi:hypothetical protein
LKNTPKDNLYEWLEIMFEFCAGKPFAYYSTYVQSPRVHSLAWRHKVNVVHFPLQRSPIRLLERHKSFRFLALTRNQWEEFQRRRSASAAIWWLTAAPRTFSWDHYRGNDIARAVCKTLHAENAALF